MWFTLGFLAVGFDSWWLSVDGFHVLIVEDVLSSSIIMLPSTIAPPSKNPTQNIPGGWLSNFTLKLRKMMGWSSMYQTLQSVTYKRYKQTCLLVMIPKHLEQWLMSLPHITVRPKCMNSIIFEEALSFLDKLVKETSPVTSGCTIIHRLIWAVVLHQWMKLSWNVPASASFHPL